MKREELIGQSERLREVRKLAGLNRREFSEYMGIPLRTLEEWEAGRRKMPEYVLRLIAYQIKTERLLEKHGINVGEEEEYGANSIV